MATTRPPGSTVASPKIADIEAAGLLENERHGSEAHPHARRQSVTTQVQEPLAIAALGSAIKPPSDC
jgi:hypothetical protein